MGVVDLEEAHRGILGQNASRSCCGHECSASIYIAAQAHKQRLDDGSRHNRGICIWVCLQAFRQQVQDAIDRSCMHEML